MDRLFPFGFPWPTAFYLTLFAITATIYSVFMQYVLGGGLVLMVGSLASTASRLAAIRPAGIDQERSGLGQIVTVLRDWMPAILGLAITTGVAPLLFVQILYRREFYTANLLLFHRFMLLLPALIVAYYMLYVIKSKRLGARGPAGRAGVAALALGCFLYTAWAWTENHVLSLHAEAWSSMYQSDAWFFRNAEIWPRLGFWMTVSFPTVALMLAWQFHWGRHQPEAGNLDPVARRLRALALLGLATSVAEAWLWLLWLEPTARAATLGMLGLPYVLAAGVGMGLQAATWLTVQSGRDLTTGRLSLISTGAVLATLATLVVREARRLAAIDITALYDDHRHAAQTGGIGLFLTFLGLNAGLVTTCVLIVRRALRPLR
jgi:hypothetical protein